MDGLLKDDSALVFLLAASNLPWELDVAMLRRLEKRVRRVCVCVCACASFCVRAALSVCVRVYACLSARLMLNAAPMSLAHCGCGCG